MKLYYNPQSRAAVAKWMLDECGADPEIVLVDPQKGEHKTPEFLKVNLSGKIRRWSTARPGSTRTPRFLYSPRSIRGRLAPPVGIRAGRYLTLMACATSQLEPAMGDELLGLETPASRGWTSFETVGDGSRASGGLTCSAIIHRRRRDDRLDVHLEAHPGPAARPRPAEAYVDRRLQRRTRLSWAG
jgi:glutathione S-transferase